MALFVRFTEEVQESSGVLRRIVFVNLDHIAKASFSDADGTLTLQFSASARADGRGNLATLRGEEAKAALEIMRKAS